MTFDEDTMKAIEDAMSPKQKRVVNFLVGQAMRKNARLDPKTVRHSFIEKLSVLTYEEEST